MRLDGDHGGHLIHDTRRRKLLLTRVMTADENPPLIHSSFQRIYTTYFISRPDRDPRRLAIISARSGQGKTSLLNTCLEKHAAHVSSTIQVRTIVRSMGMNLFRHDMNLFRHTARSFNISTPLQGTMHAADHDFFHEDVGWVLRDVPGLSGSHDVPPSFWGNKNGTLNPEQFVNHYISAGPKVDGILFIMS